MSKCKECESDEVHEKQCDDCEGSGQTNGVDCDNCNGEGMEWDVYKCEQCGDLTYMGDL